MRKWIDIVESKDPKVEKVIARFLSTKNCEPDTISGQCRQVSISFIESLRDAGIKGRLIHLMDYLGEPFRHQHNRWNNADFLNHYVVAVDQMTYDFTYGQFDPYAAVPRCTTLTDLRQDWDTVEEEKVD